MGENACVYVLNCLLIFKDVLMGCKQFLFVALVETSRSKETRRGSSVRLLLGGKISSDWLQLFLLIY